MKTLEHILNIQLLLIVLKLFGWLTLSWWSVFAPFWLVLGVWFFFFATVMIIAVIVSIKESRNVGNN